ncbi:MAG TPA: sialidase family protein, partial [Pyrinomonadaceae bacterium]|nr:sialidase family protein [Pyrinomonadaceae bacterium]
MKSLLTEAAALVAALKWHARARPSRATLLLSRATLPLRTTFLLLSLAACASAQGVVVREVTSPAAQGSGQPNLTTDDAGRVYLSWIERLGDGRFALRFATREPGGGAWSRPHTVAEGARWFVNWADFPSLVVLADGSLAAQWRVRPDAPTSLAYATDILVARSKDGGRTWGEPLRPHRDGTPTEHGFVSMFPAGAARRGRDGRLAAIWLDGREMKPPAPREGAHAHAGHGQGDMTLRYATLRPRGDTFEVEAETLLDARVCECCQTSAAVTSEGPVVVYRDRSEREGRDISIVRLRAGRWTTPATVSADNWRVDSCPVNGPSVAASGRRVAVAWFTMGDDARPRVRLAFSRDAGATFGRAVEVSDADPVGRADVVLLEDGDAVVSWIERGEGGAQLRARRVRADGTASAPVTVAPSGAARSSGFPQMIRTGPTLVFAWTGTNAVLTAEMRVRDLPRAGSRGARSRQSASPTPSASPQKS